MDEHTALPWKWCGEDGSHFCGHIWSADGNSHIVTVISGKWGDDYASLRFVEGTGGAGSLGPQIEAYMDQITYGEIPEDVAKANARLIVTACNCHADLLEALKEIAKGEGAYSQDPLTHAGNTITGMKNIATEAIRKAT